MNIKGDEIGYAIVCFDNQLCNEQVCNGTLIDIKL